jgi:glyoxylate/hydroxypyruvate reductase A
VRDIESYAGQAEFEAFLRVSDFLICLLPLTHETHGILNAKTFAMLPDGAYVINVARGGHLVEADVITAIDSGHLAGATLDVFETEPLPETSPLWRHPKIIVTPHIAAITDPRIAVQYILEGIARNERGETLENILDVDREY